MYGMASHSTTAQTAQGKHFSCTLSAVLLARVAAFGGQAAVDEVVRRSGSTRSVEYLVDITNWIAYDEAVALWRAGGEVTHHPEFARAVGVDSAERLGSSQVAAMLRSLGAPGKVYSAIAAGAAQFSTVTRLEVVDAGPGRARGQGHPLPARGPGQAERGASHPPQGIRGRGHRRLPG